MSTNKVKIYVRLIDEGTEVSRPTEALDLGNGLLELLATPDYDSEDETWEFSPGQLCDTRSVKAAQANICSQ